MKSARRIFSLAFVLVLAILFTVPVLATEPDVIGEYAITVSPQPNGNLEMAYTFTNYCATTDFPSDIQGLEVGVPNSHFTIKDFGPKGWVTNARPKTSGGSWVRLDFAKLPKKGDCFNLNFTIVQEQMANPQGEEVVFKFTPGWFDFATIKKLKITWVLPSDASLIHKLDPESVVTGNQTVWTKENLAPNQKFTVSLVYAKEAFLELSTSIPVPAENGAEENVGLGTFILISFVVLAVVIIIFLVVFKWVTNDKYGGGYTTTKTTTTPIYIPTSTSQRKSDSSYGGCVGGGLSRPGGSTASRPSSSRPSSSPRSGGGGGGFAGRGSSCVSSCACACACAGGGRVGCSLKKIGINVDHLLMRRKS